MNVNTSKMKEYEDFLQDNFNNINNLANELEGLLVIAGQCIDQESGKTAVARMNQNLENVKASLPLNEGVQKRLVKSRKYIENAGNIFHR